MKHTIAETKINKSNRSLISTIPNTIVSLESLTNIDSIRWSYEIIDNKHKYYVEFIHKNDETTITDENDKKQSSNIDETTEKTTKIISLTDDEIKSKLEHETISDNDFEEHKKQLMKTLDKTEKPTVIKNLHEPENDNAEKERYQELVKTKSNRTRNYDSRFIISIQSNQRKGKTNYKLNFKLLEDKQTITNMTYEDGSLETSCKALLDLSRMDTAEVIEFIRNNTPERNKEVVEDKLKKIGLLDE